MMNWPLLAERASSVVGTPCYVMSEEAVRDAIVALQLLETSVPLRHWLSLKTQPVARLVQAASSRGFGIDVVSEHELIGALEAGIQPDRILVNGVGKHHWLPRNPVPHLHVHFDSVAEVRALTVLARALNWRIGLRCAVPRDQRWDQFGMTPQEVGSAVADLTAAGVIVRGLHFHLGTSVSQVRQYDRALAWIADIAESAGIQPQYVDVGGGLPIAGETFLDGESAAGTFDFREYREWLASIPLRLPSVREVWLENGRFLSGPAGALVLTVLDRKLRDDCVFLICDGGRVNHARMASIERHDIVLSPERHGGLRETIVCGPTCGAIDRLGAWMLPESTQAGDRLIWLNAGAYHIPLETRFSTGLAPVVWVDQQQQLQVIRKRETPAEWWEQWVSSGTEQPALIKQVITGRFS